MVESVTFKIAKLLKKKKWTTPTLNFYFDDGEFKENILKEITGMDYSSEFTVEFSELIENWNDKFLTKKNGARCFGCDKSRGYFETYSAPIIAEVITWLHKKHRIWIVVETALGKTEKCLFAWYCTDDEQNVLCSDFDYSKDAKYHHKTPTKAYLAAIEYTLTKLI
jgi:hypothetical protein